MKKTTALIVALAMTFSGAVLPLDGNLTVPTAISATAQTVNGDYTISSTTSLNGTELIVNGNLYVTGGTLTLGSGKITVNGNCYFGTEESASSAVLKMSNANGSITVTGDFYWNMDGTTTKNTISAGTLTVGGNFTDMSAKRNFQASGTHTTILNGSGDQTVYFKPSPSSTYSTNSTLCNLQVNNSTSRKVYFNFFNVGKLLADTTIYKSPSASYVIIYPYGMALNLNGKKLNIVGDTYKSYKLELAGGTMNVTGNYYDGSNYTTFGGGSLNVTGNYSMTLPPEVAQKTNSDVSGAYLTMTSAGDTLTVGGDFSKKVTYTSSKFYSTFTAGTINIGGSFLEKSANYPFSASGTHKVVMTGSGTKTITLMGGQFNTLELKQSVGSYNVTQNGTSVSFTQSGTNYTSNPTIATTIIAPAGSANSINDASVSVASATYTGSALTPAVTVKSGSKTLTQGTDYTLSYSNNTAVGTGSVTVNGKGSYTGSKTVSFTISKAQISSASISLSGSSFTYTGLAQTPTVTAAFNGKTLTNGTDYSVAYSNNTAVGTATVTVTGKGNFTGTATKSFTISAASLSSAAVTITPTSYTYDGSAKQPTVSSVVLNGKTLTAGSDYTVSYSNNVNAGTATVTVTGKNNYTGTATKTFTISPLLAPIDLTLSQTTYTYDGTAKRPSVTVKVNGKTLTQGTDYTVAYLNNTNVGTATASVTLRGNYSGGSSASFTITAASTPVTSGKLTVSLKNAQTAFTVTAKGAATKTYTATGGTLAITDLPTGSYTITVSKSGYVTRTYTNVSVTTSNQTFVADIHRPGDIDGDGAIKAKDVTAVTSHVKAIKMLSGYDMLVADVTGDGNISSLDITAVTAHLKGLKVLW